MPDRRRVSLVAAQRSAHARSDREWAVGLADRLDELHNAFDTDDATTATPVRARTRERVLDRLALEGAELRRLASRVQGEEAARRDRIQELLRLLGAVAGLESDQRARGLDQIWIDLGGSE